MNQNSKFSVRDICYAGLFAAVIAVMAQISIPMPLGVPMTMQTFAITLAAVVLGSKLSAIATLVYLLLGAVGVQLGTRFLVAKECGVHQNYKNKVLKANDIATMSTGKRLGHPVRSIKNPYTKEYFKLEYSNISDEELEAYGRGSLYRAAVEGDEKTGCFLADQIAGMVNKEQTAKEIIEEIFTQAEDVLKGATKWVK